MNLLRMSGFPPESPQFQHHPIEWKTIMAEFTLRIDGMHCGSCVRRVNHALAAVPGIAVNEVRVGAARLSSTQDSATVDLAIAAIAKAGYTAHLES
jgi:copper chaperone